MPRCAHEPCSAWYPGWLARSAVRFDGDWFCSVRCVRDDAIARLDTVAPEQVPPTHPNRFRLGTLLVAARVLPREVLERALERHRASGRPLGAELVAMGAISVETLTQFLARQAGIGYLAGLTAAHVARHTADLSGSIVRALGVVPFELDRLGVLRVAVTAPVPVMALAVLRRMTGRQVLPYLVPDAQLVALLDAYGTAAVDRQGVHAPSFEAAAGLIADAAQAGRLAAWRCVPGQDFTWVRLEGTTGADDIIITNPRWEDTWPAASIRH